MAHIFMQGIQMYQSFPLAPGHHVSQHVAFTEPRPAQGKVERMTGTSSLAGPAGRHVWPFLATYSPLQASHSGQSHPDANSFIS